MRLLMQVQFFGCAFFFFHVFQNSDTDRSVVQPKGSARNRR